MPKPISRSLKDREGKQESFYSELSFMRKERMFMRVGMRRVGEDYDYNLKPTRQVEGGVLSLDCIMASK